MPSKMNGKSGIFGLLFLICAHHVAIAEVEVLNRVRRLINGDVVPDGKPWMAVIAYKNTQGNDQRPYLIVCGGILFDDRHVATTAHCLDDVRDPIREDEPLYIVLGLTDNTWGNTAAVQEFNLQTDDTTVIMHPDFRFVDVFENDIAVVTLTTPTINNNVSPVSLPPHDMEDNKLKKCEIFGWGITDAIASEDSFTGSLRSARMGITKTNKCNTAFFGFLGNDHICAESQSFPCYGDSGSPLLCEYNKETVWVGLNSFRRRGSCELRIPQVYTRVSFFLDWINSVITNTSADDGDDDDNDD